MGLAELVLLAVGLSMDAFAVSICKGLGMKKIDLKVAAVLGLFFGGFQAGMPVIGWALGSQFMGIIGPIDHWIAFILLAFIGGKMLWEVFRGKDDDLPSGDPCGWKNLLVMSVATSIDALAVMPRTGILAMSLGYLICCGVIALVTFVICFAGVKIGCRTGNFFGRKAEIAGGIVLILIGVKILLEHLGVLPNLG